MKDKCQICKGVRGGVPGNENIQYGMRVCDYCSADLITVERIVRAETLKAAAMIAYLTKGGFTATIRLADEMDQPELMRDTDGPWVLNSQIAERIESVQLTADGRWQSKEAMRLWGEATNRDGERLHEQFDGNGRRRSGGS